MRESSRACESGGLRQGYGADSKLVWTQTSPLLAIRNFVPPHFLFTAGISSPRWKGLVVLPRSAARFLFVPPFFMNGWMDEWMDGALSRLIGSISSGEPGFFECC